MADFSGTWLNDPALRDYFIHKWDNVKGSSWAVGDALRQQGASQRRKCEKWIAE
jgi:hypothetical protein